MSQLEAMTHKSADQLKQDASQTAFIDITGPAGNLPVSDFGYSSDQTLSQYFYSGGCPAGMLTCDNKAAATPLGAPIVLLGPTYFNYQASIGNATFSLPTPSSVQQGTLFHEFWHTEGIGDLGGSTAFDNWLNGGCQGNVPGGQ
jgi:hypothetical protein